MSALAGPLTLLLLSRQVKEGRACARRCLSSRGSKPRRVNRRSGDPQTTYGRARQPDIKNRAVPVIDGGQWSRPLLHALDGTWAPAPTQLVNSLLCLRTPVSAHSGQDVDDLGIGGEPAKRLLREGYTVVDADIKYAPTRPLQCHLRIWSDLTDEACRLTGARLIVSLTAVPDLDAHRCHPILFVRR